MDGLKDAVWVTLSAFATICTIVQKSLEDYAARKCREYLASLAAEEA